MRICIFNPEHDLCLANGRAHYVPPRSAIDFAHRDAGIMKVLYPDAYCCSVYDLSNTSFQLSVANSVVAWGWDLVVKQELLKRGIEEGLLPTDNEIETIRELQHRSTILPLQPDCYEIHSVEEMYSLLHKRENWVMKAPWSGAGRGLHWVRGGMTAQDRDWLVKTVAAQRCVIVEPRREVLADVALEYRNGIFFGYSYFKTGGGVYKENILWSDERIETAFSLLPVRIHIEKWMETKIWPRYQGPLGVDLMICTDGDIKVAEINFRHTMGMVAHEKLKVERYGNN